MEKANSSPDTRDEYRNKRNQYLIILIIIIAPLYLFQLGNYALMEPDEGRYAEIPREMLESGDYITPYLNYVRYLEKPPLCYWSTALSIQIFGQNEFAIRFPVAIFGIGLVIATYLAGSYMFGLRTGFISALITASCPLFFGFSRIVTLDMIFSFFINAGLFSFYTAYKEKKRLFFLISYALFAFATLAKSPIGILFPVVSIAIFLLVNKELKLIKELRIISGIIVFLIIVLPWFIAISLCNEGFLQFYFIREHLMRYTTEISRRPGHPLLFTILLTGGMLPWSVLLPGSVVFTIKEKLKPLTFLSIFTGFLLLFFSFSSSKLPGYILPAIAPCGILCGYSFDRLFLQKRETDKRLRKIIIILAAIILITVITGAAIVGITHIAGRKGIGLNTQDILTFMIPLAVGIILSFIFVKMKRAELAFASLFAGTMVLLILIIMNVKTFEPRYANKNIAEELNKNLTHESRIYVYATRFETFASISFYTGRRLIIVGEHRNSELEYGRLAAQESEYFITKDEFYKILASNEKIFILTKSKQQKVLEEIMGHKLNLLNSNYEQILLTN
ncbi:MAG: glycosyltransferase family 39 protein [Planctomycetota bacterium]